MYILIGILLICDALAAYCKVDKFSSKNRSDGERHAIINVYEFPPLPPSRPRAASACACACVCAPLLPSLPRPRVWCFCGGGRDGGPTLLFYTLP